MCHIGLTNRYLQDHDHHPCPNTPHRRQLCHPGSDRQASRTAIQSLDRNVVYVCFGPQAPLSLVGLRHHPRSPTGPSRVLTAAAPQIRSCFAPAISSRSSSKPLAVRKPRAISRITGIPSLYVFNPCLILIDWNRFFESHQRCGIPQGGHIMLGGIVFQLGN